MNPAEPQRFFIVASAATELLSLFKILNLASQVNALHQDQTATFFYAPSNFMDQEELVEKPLTAWSAYEKRRVIGAYQGSFANLEAYAQKAQAQAKIAIVGGYGWQLASPTARARFQWGILSVPEPTWRVNMPLASDESEVFSSGLNETVLPDSVLLHYLPVFLIRHPALVIPTGYRRFVLKYVTEEKDLKSVEAKLRVYMTTHWVRTLYHFHAVEDMRNWTCRDIHPEIDVDWPLVLDADELYTIPELMDKFCAVLGLDSLHLARVNEEEMSKEPGEAAGAVVLALKKAMESDTIRGRPSLSIEVEARKWRDDFGGDMGRKIETWVRDSMPEYEFLWSRRLAPSGAS